MTEQFAYPDDILTEVFIGSSWVDLSSYVVDAIDIDGGIMGNSPTDKMAYIGGTRFTLNNNSGIFTPNTIDTLSGWKKGIKVRHVIYFEGVPYVIFVGKIKKIGLPYTVEEDSLVPVSTVDWLDDASNHNVTLQGIETDITTGAAAQILLDASPVQPEGIEIDIGSDTISAFFTDTDKDSTTYSELGKLALTEFAFVYLKEDRLLGRVLKVESRQSRVSVEPTSIVASKTNSPRLRLQNGKFLKLQNDAIFLLNKSIQPIFDNMTGMDTEFGENLINHITVTNNKPRVDTSLQVLFNLDEPIRINAGQTLPDLKVSYKDPTGGSGRVNGKDMQPAASGTDYAMFANQNGTGTNLTANLTFTVEYGSSGAVYRSPTNTGGTDGWITKLQARGYGVYSENPIELFLEDQPSIEEFGLSVMSIDNAYQSNMSVSETIATTTLGQNKDNRVVPTKIKLIANLNSQLMIAYLMLGVGNLIQVKQDKHQINDNFFIQSKKSRIHQGGVIEFEFGLVDALFANETYWELDIDGKSELEETTFISF